MALQKTPTSPAPVHALPPPVSASAKPPAGAAGKPTSLPFWIGLSVSIAWFCAVFLIIAKAGPARSFGGVALVDWAIGISAAVPPVALVWMITAYLQRASDIQTIADPLRRQLTLITGESGAADARIRRFNQAIREQVELLRCAQTVSQDDLEGLMERVRQHRGDLERFDAASINQVREIQDVIRRSMLQAEQMMDDKFTMLRFLDDKLQQNGDGVARQVESVRDQVARMLQDVEAASAQMADALERAQRDSKKLADTSRLQESSLTGAAEAAAETLGGLSSKIDLSVAAFLERASSARQEAERLAHALDAQTRSLDEFSGTLPTRVSEAESILRGVADRLYASEQMAREQAVHLSEKLSQQVDGLQGFMDRFTARLTDIDGGLDRRHADLHALGERIAETTTGFVSSWEASLTDLNDRTGKSLQRFAVVNDETRRNADAVTAHLSETAGKYEDAVVRMRALSADSGHHMRGMTEEIARHLSQFESLSKASTKAGEEVQQRATAALQNLQHVLERVLAAREATQLVGETLVKDIYSAVDQNEKMIQRLSETAQMGARAIGTAAEQLGRQESELAGKARAGEALMLESVQKLQKQAETASVGLRDQTATLMNLLAETQGQLASTDQKLQSFAAQAVTPVQAAIQQIDASADQGLRALTGYGDGLNQQVVRLQDFHVRIGGMSQEIGKTTVESVGAFEQLNSRFAAIRDVQSEAARQTLAQFADLSDRLQREVAGLDGQTAQAVDILQQAALRVGEQSYQMLENARSSGVQMRDVTAALQSEAAQIQATLRRQSEEIGGDLMRAEQKFAALGETIRERADAAHTVIDRAASHYDDVSRTAFDEAGQRFAAMGDAMRDRAEAASALLDRTTAHYNIVSQTLSQDIDERAQKIETVLEVAQNKAESLRVALAGQAQQIDDGAARIETHAAGIAASGDHAAQAVARLEQCAGDFVRRAGDMAGVADGAVGAVGKAADAFGEQTGRLVDGAHQVDAVLRQLTQATGSLADQSAQIRIGMEQQNNRLLTQLAASVAQLDVTGGKLQQLVTVAVQGADQAGTRFADMTETSTRRLVAATGSLRDIAERSEATLAALGANITQQAASLSVVGEQMGEQQRIMTAANESQRAQMIDLFDRLGAAHKQASDVAERSIASLTDSLQQIHRQMGLVGNQSQEAVGTVKNASAEFSQQASLLIQNAQAAEQQARTVLSVTGALQEQARHLRETLQAESERANESLGSLLSRLTAGGSEVRELGVSTGAVFATLQRAIGDQSNELGVSMHQIAERQRSLTAALDQQRETINGLLNRLTLAQDETAATAERAAGRINDNAQQMTRHMEAIDARSQSALISVQAAATGFAHEAQAIEIHARQAEQQTRAILASASGMNEQIHDLRDNMQAEGERTGVMLGALLDKVTMGAAEMRDLGAATEMSLTSLGNNVMQQSAALTSTMQQIGDRQRSLSTALDAQRDVIGGLLNRLTLAQDETADTADRVVARLADGAQQIARHAESIDARTKDALAGVQAANLGFAREAEAIDLHARKAEQQARSVLETAADVQAQMRDIRDAMQSDGDGAAASLSGLLDKMAVGRNDIRESGAVADTVLQSLQRAIAEQTGELGTSMQQIGERQRGLTADLERQRELINSLLNRLTLAQDETALTAERAASRIEDGARQIERQMDSIDAHAAATLAGVRESADGFAEQATALGLQGQQAEQQMRGVLSVTAGMHEQARHLREAMQVETAGAIEHLAAVIAQLDATGRQLRSESGAATQILENSARQFADASQTGSAVLRSQSELLAQTADQSEARLSAAGEKIAAHLRLAGDMGNQAEAQARQLADTAEFATTRLVSLRNSMIAGDADGRNLMDAASQRIEDVKTTLQEALRQLSDLSQAASEQVAACARGLAGQSDALRANLAASESALTEAAGLVREESAHLPALLGRNVAEIEGVTRALKSHAADADRTMIGTADRFIAVTGAARSAMIDEMQRIGAVTETADQTLRGLNQMLAEQVVSVQKNTALLSGEQKELVEKAALSIGALAKAIDRLSILRGEASATAERLTQEFDLLDQRASATTGRMAQTGEAITRQMDAMSEAAIRAEGQIAGASQGLREQLERIRAGLQGQIDDINRGLMQITAQLERTGATLRSAAVGSVADVERIGQRFEQTGGEAARQIESRVQQMRTATEEVAKLLAGFDGQFDQTLDRMALAGEGIKRQQGGIVDHLQTTLAHLGSVAEKLESAREMSGNVSQDAIERLDDVVNAVQAHMNSLTSGAQTAAGVMRGIGQIYGDQTQTLSKGVGEAHNQVLTMNRSIDEMQERTDRMRASLKLQGDELMASLRQILTQLEMTGDGLSEAVDRTLQQQAADELKKMG